MYSTFFTCVSQDRGGGIEDVEFGGVGGYGEGGGGDDANDCEEGPGGFPALGAAAGVVVEDVSFDSDFNFVGGAEAFQDPALEGGGAFCDAIVE